MELRNWLNTTTAGQIRSREVKPLRPRDTLSEAAEMLLAEQVTGAPVVSDEGVVVGVFSANDLLTAEMKVSQTQRKIESGFFSSSLALPASVYASRLAQMRDQMQPALEQPAEKFMTSDLVSVTPDTPLATVVQHMVDAHVHRVLVLDENKRLLGIATTTDVLAVLLQAGR